MADAAKKKPTPSDRMRVRTNPHYQMDVDPTEQEWAYVNPVQLNNDLITIANELLTLAEASAHAVRANQRLRLDKRKLERAQEDFETDLLAKDPLAPSEAKSLKTIAAAIERRVQQQQLSAIVSTRREQIRALEDEIDQNDATIRAAKLYYDAGEKVSDNITVHLSWVKDERRRT